MHLALYSSLDRREVNQREVDHHEEGVNRDRVAVNSLEFRQDLSEELLQVPQCFCCKKESN